MKAKVKWWNESKGYGFLESPDQPTDIFVHYTSINGDGFKTLEEGESVECDILDHPKGPIAGNVTRLK